MQPSALIRIATGIGSLTLAIVASMVDKFPVLELSDTLNCRGGILELSAWDLISATQEYFEGGFLWKTRTMLEAMRSFAMMTFSLPLMMKYPP
jgi:hypothetical protein